MPKGPEQSKFGDLISWSQGLLPLAMEQQLPGRKLETGALLRIERALQNRFLPYALEAEHIGRQLKTDIYENYLIELRDFLGPVKPGYVVCPDGRIIAMALGSPRITSITRRLRGMSDTRKSSRTGEPIVVNPNLSAAIKIYIKNLNSKFPGQAKLIEFIGPHINSADTAHGCGAAAGRKQSTGIPIVQGAIWDGGIRDYFTEAEQNGVYEAFDNAAENAGGRGFSLDVIHDIYSQGLIIGLRKYVHELDSKYTLRQNLENLAVKGKIVMTEWLAHSLRDEIIYVAQKFKRDYDVNRPLNIRDYRSLVNNEIMIGKIAMEMTHEIDKPTIVIPEHILSEMDGASSERAAMFHMVRNAVYQVLGGVIPGQHSLVHHPEKLLRSGPIGPDFNVTNIPFVQVTPDFVSDDDIKDTFAIYNLMEKFLPGMGIDLENEARVVVFTGEFNPNIYINPETRMHAKIKAAKLVQHNAAKFRDLVHDAWLEGYVVVLTALHNPVTRSIELV